MRSLINGGCVGYFKHFQDNAFPSGAQNIVDSLLKCRRENLCVVYFLLEYFHLVRIITLQIRFDVTASRPLVGSRKQKRLQVIRSGLYTLSFNSFRSFPITDTAIDQFLVEQCFGWWSQTCTYYLPTLFSHFQPQTRRSTRFWWSNALDDWVRLIHTIFQLSSAISNHRHSDRPVFGGAMLRVMESDL